jgi:hypothetical protein
MIMAMEKLKSYSYESRKVSIWKIVDDLNFFVNIKSMEDRYDNSDTRYLADIIDKVVDETRIPHMCAQDFNSVAAIIDKVNAVFNSIPC